MISRSPSYRVSNIESPSTPTIRNTKVKIKTTAIKEMAIVSSHSNSSAFKPLCSTSFDVTFFFPKSISVFTSFLLSVFFLFLCEKSAIYFTVPSRSNGIRRKIAFPRIYRSSIIPIRSLRLSSEKFRLSPITNTESFGTVQGNSIGSFSSCNG